MPKAKSRPLPGVDAPDEPPTALTPATLTRALKVLAAGKDLHEKLGAVLTELDNLLGGRGGIAARIRTFEQAFDAAWCTRYAPGETGRYIWSFARDRQNLKRLLPHLTDEQLTQRVAAYIADEDAFLVRQRHPFALFAVNANKYSAAPAPKGPAPSADQTRAYLESLRKEA